MYKKSLVFLIFLVLIIGCLDTLEFERPDSIKNGLTIQGHLSKGNPSSVKVIIKEVFDFFTAPRFITVKKVYLIDEKDNQVELATRIEGIYTLEIPDNHPTFKIKYYKGYKIKVIDKDNNIFESDYDTIFPTPVPTNLEVKEVSIQGINAIGEINEKDVLGFFIDTPLKASDTSSNNSRILWELEGVSKVTDLPRRARCSPPVDDIPKSCYVSNFPVKNYLTFDGKASSQESLENKLLNETLYTYWLSEGYYLVVHQQSVSDATYDYWTQVQLITNRTGDVFQEPVGVVTTNFKTEANDILVFGFFYATEPKAIRVYVSPKLGREQPRQCPLLGPEDGCCNCKNFPSSTTIKPDWWIE